MSSDKQEREPMTMEAIDALIVDRLLPRGAQGQALALGSDAATPNLSYAEQERRLADDTLEAPWAALAPHFHRRQSLWLAGPALPVHVAGAAIAQDQAAIVRAWTDAKLLRKPTPEEAARWDAAATETQFRFVIIRPFVIAQLLQIKPHDPVEATLDDV